MRADAEPVATLRSSAGARRENVLEVVMSWPGLGALMYEALVARDLFLVAGCAVAVSTFLAFGVFVSDLALVAADPRRGGLF